MRLYFKYLSVHLKSRMQYKASFFLETVSQFITSFSSLLGIWFLMAKFHTADGFSLYEILLCFSVVFLSFALSECFFRGFDVFPSLLGDGQFDRILLRPRNAVFQVVASTVQFTRFGRILQAVCTFIFAVVRGNICWNIAKIAVLAMMILCGTALFCALYVLRAAISFFTTESLEIFNIFTDGSREFGSFPLSVYGKTILRFYTFVVPMALVQYYPLLFLTDRSANPLYAVAPVCALLFFIPAWIFWKIGVRHYRSTGS